MTLRWHEWPMAASTIARTFGWRGGALRVRHELRRRLSRFAESPRHEVAGVGEPLWWLSAPRERLARATDAEQAAARAARVIGGEHQAFRAGWRPLPRTAAEWHRNAGAAEGFPADAPWFRIPLLSRVRGDVKDVWEPARFGWAYDLIRAYVALRDESAADAFYSELERWAAANPPFMGVHWACGQETAIRATALLYAEANLADAGGATLARRTLLTSVLGWSGERIADAIGYAVSQRNNHGISEALGLALLGCRLRDVHPRAAEWWRTGSRLLERLVREQFAEDGWYAQHSFTYQRLALDQLAIAQRLFVSEGHAFSSEARERIVASHRLLVALVDAQGDVPNHGANDGAFVQPITLAPYRDFRPVLTTVAAAFALPIPEDIAPDAEAAAWVNAAPVMRAPPRADGIVRGASGWIVATHRRLRLFVRAGHYTSRPAHIDALHLDVRVDDRPFVADAGSYAYNAPPPWNLGFSAAACHNGPIVNGHEPGVRGPRFLWYRWPNARIASAFVNGEVIHIAAERDGVRRTITCDGERIVVEDAPESAARSQVEAHWLLADGVAPSVIESAEIRETIAATANDPRGWLSWRYGERTPGTLVRVCTAAGSSHALLTVLRVPPPAP